MPHDSLRQHRLLGLPISAFWVVLIALALSSAIHVVAIVPSQPVQHAHVLVADLGLRKMVAAGTVIQRTAWAAQMRRAWYEKASSERRAGVLRLGQTLLEANSIDAFAEGVEFDMQRALLAFEARRQAFRSARGELGVRHAVSSALADISYAGIPGGRMGDALLAGRGACEPLSHLIVSLLFDEQVEGVAFRYYGGSVGGVTHLAPVLTEAGVEHDLTAGGPSHAGGRRFEPSDILDVIARAHGLIAGATAQDSDANVFGKSDPSHTWSQGYPPNDTQFPGALPLFASKAVRAPRQQNSARPISQAVTEQDEEVHCAAALRLSMLDPTTIEMQTPSGWVSAIVERTPRDESLERFAGLALRLESQRNQGSTSERVMRLACLVGVYKRSWSEFAMVGKDEVAQRASREALRAQQEGAALLAQIAAAPGGLDALYTDVRTRSPGEEWVLLFLPGGDRVVLASLSAPTTETSQRKVDLESNRIVVSAALLVAPETREDVLRGLRAYPARQQVEVMHELFGAYDATQPWASTYLLTPPAGSERDPFVRGYDVFRAMAWALWDADRPLVETLNQLERHLAEAPEADALREELFAYFVRYSLARAIISHRDRSIVDELSSWLESHGLAESNTNRQLLADMRGATRFDLQALADALRTESKAQLVSEAVSQGPGSPP